MTLSAHAKSASPVCQCGTDFQVSRLLAVSRLRWHQCDHKVQRFGRAFQRWSDAADGELLGAKQRHALRRWPLQSVNPIRVGSRNLRRHSRERHRWDYVSPHGRRHRSCLGRWRHTLPRGDWSTRVHGAGCRHEQLHTEHRTQRWCVWPGRGSMGHSIRAAANQHDR